MNKIIGAGAALLLSTGLVSAGGLDRSGQPIGVLFESGNYAELSFGVVQPSVSGVFGPPGLSSGDMASTYTSFGLAYKSDFNDRLSLAVIWEQTYGADVDYTNADPGYPIDPFTASLSGHTAAALLRYKINDNVSVHGGIRVVTMSGEIDFTAAGGTPVNYGGSTDLGYTIGASYEIPDIALRVSLTYNSATSHNNPIDDPGGMASDSETGSYTLPQTVSLDLQTGIAQNTLLLASIRWAEWTATELNTQSALGTIDYDNDVVTYSLGIARRFNDSFSGVVRVTYEEAKGGLASNLAPTDGSLGLTLAGIYSLNDMTITAGLNFTNVGDATTEFVNADFSGNTAVGLGIKVGYNF